MLASILLGLIVVLVYFMYFYRERRLKEEIDKIPGPDTLPILGNAHQLRFGHAWFLQILDFAQVYSSKGIFRVWLAKKPVVATCNPDHIEALLSSTKHIDKAREYDFLHPWLGTGLLTSTGEKWHRRRKMLTPTFHFNILNDFVDVFNRQSAVLIKKLHRKSKDGAFDIFQDIALCALDVICETAMGKTVDAQSTDSEYVKAVYRMTTLMDERMRKPLYWNDTLYKMFGPGKEYEEKLKILHDFTNAVISDRIKDFNPIKMEMVGEEFKGMTLGGKKIKMAFLDMLLYMSDNLTKLNLDDIREEVDTFMFEGHDTTAAAMNWATHLIGSNPDVQAKVHEEVDRIFGEDDRPATPEDLKEMKYIECCIKEALRLFPSVPLFGRSITEDLQLGEFTVPKGTTAVVMVTALHRNPVTFPDPEAYKPERFFLENSRHRHPYSYIPFSAGPRNCIGQKFALLEQKVVLSSIFRNFNVKSTQTRDELRPVGDLILRPESGIKVEMTPRTAQ